MFSDSLIHPLNYSGVIPETLNNPFFYTPHDITRAAVSDLLPHIQQLMENHDEGKMFGVLVVEKCSSYPEKVSKICYLAAFSGQIGDKSVIPGFVPPIFDILKPNGYFKTHEAEISEINNEISFLESNPKYIQEKDNYNKLSIRAEVEIENSKKKLVESKTNREFIRSKGNLSVHEQNNLIKESQYFKAEHKRLQRKWTQILSDSREKIKNFEEKIAKLKSKRKLLSESLQKWIFSQYKILNYKGESCDISTIFSKQLGTLPPAGTGDCCEPKLLQFALANNLKPLQIGMFWWENSHKNDLKIHLKFYPACSGKCKPLLEYMLPSTVFYNSTKYNDKNIDIIYQDDDIWVVYKPSGLLSVPGKGKLDSVYSILKNKYPQTEPLIVHRLDMDTSGLLIVAKNKQSHYILQQQFVNHQIKKTYIAVLEGDELVENDCGEISLPLSPDYMNRPFQIVDFEHGKKALTIYRVLSEHVVELQPLTGRTHQLRVHCAHPNGLNRPIKGDNLYGNTGGKLQLCAYKIQFTHPETCEKMTFEYQFSLKSGEFL